MKGESNTKGENIPDGWKESEKQYFGTFEIAEKFIGDQCKNCTKEKSCDKNNSLKKAMGNNFPIWFEEFIKIEKIASGLEEKVICKDFDQIKERGC